MHQIRVHLAHGGHPILGDKLYSGEGAAYIEWMANGWTPALKDRLVLPRHALHASVLKLPLGGRMMEWNADLAADLTDFVQGKEVRETPGVVIWSRHD